MLYDAILYDLDGTLVDSVPLILRSYRQAYLDVFGCCSRSDEDFLSYIGRPLIDAFSMHDKDTATKLFNAYLEYNCALLEKNEVPLFDGVLEGMLELKKKGVLQGIVTAKLESSAEVTLRLLGIDKFCDIYIYHGDSQKHKPDPEPLFVAADRLNIKDMKRVLYVGDAMPDVLCAHNANAAFALVSWTRMKKDEILKQSPEHIINSIRELSCIID